MNLRKKIINFNLSRNIEKALLLINSSLIKEVTTYAEITNGEAGLYYLTVEDNTDPNDVKEIGEYIKLTNGSIVYQGSDKKSPTILTTDTNLDNLLTTGEYIFEDGVQIFFNNSTSVTEYFSSNTYINIISGDINSGNETNIKFIVEKYKQPPGTDEFDVYTQTVVYGNSQENIKVFKRVFSSENLGNTDFVELTNPYFTETFNVGQIYGGSNVYDYPYGSGNLGGWHSFHNLYGVGGYSHSYFYGTTADINPVSVPPIYTAKERIKLNEFQIFGTPYTNPYYLVKILKIDIKNNTGLSTLMSEQEFRILGGFDLHLDASIDNGKLNDVIIEKGESIIVLWKCTYNSRAIRTATFNLKFEKI